MTRAAALSHPAEAVRWPAQMRAETAAAYLDEVSSDAFLRGVRSGLYPAGIRVPGKGLRWAIEDLDAALAKIRNTRPRPRSLKDRIGSSP